MAVIKCRVEVTLYKVIDVDKVTRYYLLQSSTLAAPSKPADGAAISSKWSKTEPSYTSGSTMTLYFVDQTVMSNGALKYSEVSKSSSYEAAKEAYNKAVAAANTANNVQTAMNALNIGGRNLIRNSKFTNTSWNNSNCGVSIIDTNGSLFSYTTDGIRTVKKSGWGGTGILIETDITPIKYEKTVTLSFDLKIIKFDDIFFSASGNTTSDNNWLTQSISTTDRGVYDAKKDLNNWHRVSCTIKIPAKNSLYEKKRVVLIRLIDGQNGGDYEYYMKNLKLELGNIATDWTPAPEDVETRIDDAYTEIESNKTAISLKASQTETAIISDKLNTYIDSSTTMIQNVNSWQFNFDKLIKTDEADVANHQDYITFQNGDIILGESGSDLKLKIANDSIQFKGTTKTEITPDSDATAWITGKQFNINRGEIHEYLRVGNLVLMPKENGNFTIDII